MVSVPSETPLAKNCTLAMEFDDVAAARMVVGTLMGTLKLAAGLLIETTGGVPAATVTIAEVVFTPTLSVATAVRPNVPETAGVHETL